jgi:hypothetical protein
MLLQPQCLSGLPPGAAICATISRGLAPYYQDLLEDDVPGEMLALAFRLRDFARFAAPPHGDVVTGILGPDVATRLILAERRRLGLTWADPERR